MLNDFNYTLISDFDKGGEFQNLCNEILDFQTNEYEVCMQEMLLTVGAWDNVRAGANIMRVDTKTMGSVIITIAPGAYQSIPKLVTAMNDAIIEFNKHFLVSHEGASDDVKARLYPLM